MVFYRKYRPQTLAELDSKVVRDRLTQILEVGTIPHAFLFMGPKGTGKTSAARIIAKAVNCEVGSRGNLPAMQEQALQAGVVGSKGERDKTILPKTKDQPARNASASVAGGRLTTSIEPCNKCEACVSITVGNNLDVLEIDAASNRGIEEIRSLREKIRLAPIAARFKVYIIDEVHMLTTEAFNALLKTLEEPPPHAIFILATTDAHKVPATVRSRAIEVTFHQATSEEIVRALHRVVVGEKLMIDEEALTTIASISDGAFRDAVKILEEASHSGKRIDTDLVNALVGRRPDGEVEFLRLLASRDGQKLLALTAEFERDGADPRFFVEAILRRLHAQFLAFYQLDGAAAKSRPDLTHEEVISLLTLLSEAWSGMRRTSIPVLPLELAIARWCETKSSRGFIASSEGKENEEEKNISKPSTGFSTISIEQLVNAVKKHNQSLAALLRSCRKLTQEDDSIMIETPYQFHFDRLSEPKMIALLGETASVIAGKQVKVQAQLIKK